MTARKRLLQIASGGCVCYLPMWEGAGTRVEDVSGNNNHGTITGATWAVATGELRNGLSFDGNDYVDCGHDASLEPAQITLAAWVKPSDVSALETIMGKSTWEPKGYNMYIYSDDGGVTAYLYVTAGDGTNLLYLAGASARMYANVWQFVTAVIEADGDVYLYINGQLVSSDTTTLTGFVHTTDYNLTIGKFSWAGANYFKGVIDEVRVWNRALSATEIALDYYRTCRGVY